jgi:hypothetical protein
MRNDDMALPEPLDTHVNTILKAPRTSPASPHAKRITENFLEAYMENETDGIGMIIQDLLAYDVGVAFPIHKRKRQLSFNGNHMPDPLRTDSEFPKLMKPCPDLTIGYTTFTNMVNKGNHFSSPFNNSEEIFINSTAPTTEVHFTFLTAEGKSEMDGGNNVTAELQCARTGVNIVKYLGDCYAKAGIAYTVLETSHLSIALTARAAQIYIHWEEQVGSKKVYWMQCIWRAGFHNKEEVEIYRQILKNHMGWSLGPRLASLKTVVCQSM